MTGASFITPEMLATIGMISDPYVYEIGKESIRRWADAIGDGNPLYHDEAYARRQGYRSLPAPPGFIQAYAYPVKAGKPPARPAGLVRRFLHAGDEFNFFLPVQAGDTVVMTRKVNRIYERTGKNGLMLFTETEFTYHNQLGQVVAVNTQTIISY